VKWEETSKLWVTAVAEDSGCELPGVALPLRVNSVWVAGKTA